MADLLASLETSFNERTNVGAASRLRNQVLIIDKFMADQRQTDNPFAPPTTSQTQENISAFSQPIPPHHLGRPPGQRNIPALSSVSDANIDPSLQSTTPPTTMNMSIGGAAGVVYQTVGTSGFGFGENGTVNGIGRMNGAAEDEHLQFQIPPELLEGWPWPFDTTGVGFGGV